MRSIYKEKLGNPISEHIPGKIIMGGEIDILSLGVRQEYASYISEELGKHQDKTKLRSSIELERDMREARAILCLHPETEQLLAFAKLEYFGINDAKQIIYEFGSWIGKNGYGRDVLEAGRDLAAQQFPYARLIAIVRPSNLKAQRIITESGGIKVGYLDPLVKHIYDITRRQQPTNVIKLGQGGIWINQQNQGHIL